jgi:hypothetical protein
MTLIRKPEVHDVAVLDDIFLALKPHLAGVFAAHFAVVGDESIVGDGFGANDAKSKTRPLRQGRAHSISRYFCIVFIVSSWIGNKRGT